MPILGSMYTLLNGSTYTAPTGYTGSLLGYNRFVYVYTDTFGNKIYMPLDADIANQTILKLNLSAAVDPANTNETTITINGLAGYYTDFGTKFVPFSNAQIFLYYGADINYAKYNPEADSKQTGEAMLCAYGECSNLQSGVVTGLTQQLTAQQAPICNSAESIFGIGQSSPLDCALSDPSFTNPPSNPKAQNAYQVTYQTQYVNGQCVPAASSLLAPVTGNCNIYGNDGVRNIPSDCNSGSLAISGERRYCVPMYANGTGICTSQLGMISAPLSTDQYGRFSSRIVACGTGTAQIVAKFYGYPYGQPFLVNSQAPYQTLLGYSADPNAGTPQQSPSEYSKGKTFSVLNYYWSPNETTEDVQIGLFELSSGNINLTVLILSASTAIALAFLMRKRSGYK
jgi:hypothetical protein